MTDLPITNIDSIKDVEMFFEHLIGVEGLNMHPDTRFAEYVDAQGNPYFSAEKAEVREALMDQAFEVCERTGIDIHIVAQVIFLEHLHSE